MRRSAPFNRRLSDAYEKQTQHRRCGRVLLRSPLLGVGLGGPCAKRRRRRLGPGGRRDFRFPGGVPRSRRRPGSRRLRRLAYQRCAALQSVPVLAVVVDRAGASVLAASVDVPVSEPRWALDRQRIRPRDADARRVPLLRQLRSRAYGVDGWTAASTRECAAYVRGLLDGPLGGQPARDRDDPLESGISTPQRHRSQRSSAHARVLRAPRRLPDARHCRRGCAVSRRAVRALDGLSARSASQHAPRRVRRICQRRRRGGLRRERRLLQVCADRGDRHRARQSAVVHAGRERKSRHVREAARRTARGRSGRQCDAVSGIRGAPARAGWRTGGAVERRALATAAAARRRSRVARGDVAACRGASLARRGRRT